MQGLDEESKLILSWIPVLEVILKNCVREYVDYFTKEIYPLLSDEKILINVHVDIEPQKNYCSGYPVERRGLYYVARKLFTQILVVSDAPPIMLHWKNAPEQLR